MTVDRKLSPASAESYRDKRRQASNFDMFESLRQTQLKESEAKRKRLPASSAPISSPVPEDN